MIVKKNQEFFIFIFIIIIIIGGVYIKPQNPKAMVECGYFYIIEKPTRNYFNMNDHLETVFIVVKHELYHELIFEFSVLCIVSYIIRYTNT